MERGAEVRDTGILRELVAALRELAERGETALQAHERLINRTQRQLNDEVRERRAQAERRKAEARAARRELERCREGEQDCGPVERAYREKARRSDRAGERLRKARRARKAFDDEVKGYREAARRLHMLVRDGTDEAIGFLRDRTEELEVYLSGSVGAARSSGAGGGTSDLGSTVGDHSGSGPRFGVTGFNVGSSPLDDQDVAVYLERLPQGHTRRLASVEYVERYDKDEGGVVLGRSWSTVDGRLHVQIYMEHPDGWASVWGLRDTLAHEVAHGVWRDRLSEDEKDRWRDLYRFRKDREEETGRFVTHYARDADAEEDFCESYAVYVNYPDHLRTGFADEYLFLRDVVFDGREYR